MKQLKVRQEMETGETFGDIKSQTYVHILNSFSIYFKDHILYALKELSVNGCVGSLSAKLSLFKFS